MEEQQPMAFTPEGKKEQQTKIKILIDELKGAAINEHNYKQWQDRLQNQHDTILSLIESMNDELQTVFQQYQIEERRYADEVSKDPRMNGVVYIDMHKHLFKMFKTIKDIAAWKNIQIEMNDIFIKKIAATLGETQALEIKKQAIQEMRQMEQEKNKIMLEMFTHKDAEINTKFLSGMQTISRENNIEKKEMISLFQDIIKQNTEQMLSVIRSLAASQHVPVAFAKQQQEDVTSARDTMLNAVNEHQKQATKPLTFSGSLFDGEESVKIPDPTLDMNRKKIVFPTEPKKADKGITRSGKSTTSVTASVPDKAEQEVAKEDDDAFLADFQK